MKIRRILLPLAIPLAAFALVACGGDADVETTVEPAESEAPLDPEALSAEVEELEALAAARQDELLAAESALEEAGAALRSAQAGLEDTQLALLEARKRLAVAAPPPPRRSDAEIFRLVQLSLLESEALAQVAVGVDVVDGVVVLRGRVPDEATREAALEIARTAAAPAPVRDGIELPTD